MEENMEKTNGQKWIPNFLEAIQKYVIVDILLTFHMVRRHLTGNEKAQAVGMLQAGKVQRTVAGHLGTHISCMQSVSDCL
jgi:hypothetical protein